MSLLLIVLLAQEPPADAGAGYARRTAYARVSLAQQIAADLEIVAAIHAKNRTPETQDEIHGKDVDKSSSTYGVQLSVLASERAERIGAITLTLKVPPAASSAKP